MTIRGLKEEKGMKPMFPRVHVNDTEKGGPRAPPRNQMAVYEKFSIPSESRLSGSASIWTLPPSSRPWCSFVFSASPSQVQSHERILKSSSPPSGIGLDTSTGSNGTKMTGVSDFRRLSAERPMPPNKDSNKRQLSTLHGSRNSPGQNLRALEYTKSLFLDQTGVEQSNCSNQLSKGPEKAPQASLHLLPRQRQSQSCQDPLQGPCSISLASNDGLGDKFPATSSKAMKTEPTKRPCSSINQETASNSEDETEGDAILRDEFSLECSGRGASEIKGEPFLQRCSNYEKGVMDSSAHCYACVSSIVNPESAANLSPAYVMAVLGEKNFWKIRRSLVIQQKIFTAQVFELHRLIKVQKLMPRLPHLLHGINIRSDKPATSPLVNMPPLALQPAPMPQVMKTRAEGEDVKTIEALPLPSISNNTSKDLLDMDPCHMPLKPVPTDTRLIPQCFPAPGNQWLVPIMSPSEGLVYKPFPGPDPPPMAPIHAGPCPSSLTGGELPKTAFGFPAPPTHTNFPPYGIPVPNLSLPGPAIEHVSPFSPAHHGSCSVSSQPSQALQCCFKKPVASKESDPQVSTTSSPLQRSELQLFPTEPISQSSNGDKENRNQGSVRAIKAIPHNPRTAYKTAARIFQFIQEERRQDYHD